MLTPEEQRRFAIDVVRRLRAAGHEAYWAGGCVRDQLLGRTPKDYDVATNATPPQVRELFGRRRTLAIGAAFGVIAVLGPRSPGMVEVTTFRRDAAYSDGRHPDSVTFSSAEEDASRRDFTINGLFYDPIEERVIDFVGGRADLTARIVRAIGNARHRFAEDKLRMLRAVRFAATFDFALDADTRAAIAEMASEIEIVSPERIAMEMRRLLADAGRAAGIRMLVETSLASHVLPEIMAYDETGGRRFDESLERLSRLDKECGFPLALATLVAAWVDREGAVEIGRRWRLSNKESDRVAWLVENQSALLNAETERWSAVQPLLIAEGIADLLAMMEASSSSTAAAVGYCRQRLAQPRETLNPPPLLTGDDLKAAGIPAGPCYKDLLDRVRAAQLDGEICTREEALGQIGGEGREAGGVG